MDNKTILFNKILIRKPLPHTKSSCTVCRTDLYNTSKKMQIFVKPGMNAHIK